MTWTAGAVGYFDVANNWDGGEVPGSSDTMVLADGTVYLAGDATINNLKMSGGELVVGSSECPDGWSTTLTFDGCVRAYATPKTWLEAEELASLLWRPRRTRRPSASRTAAESRGEEFAPGAEPCWIGITDSYANASGAAPPREQVSRPDAGGAAADDGAWAWADEAAVLYDPLYRSWARREPLFRGGANCGALLHRGYDPYSPPRPRWRTHLCSEAPAVCTARRRRPTI
ncbi:hypothetical protein JL721_8630 [Aureococcus anophagefferens]|nr:hypothetical protein JL721_8630 [Aureococcus anophagefferens]